MKTQSRARTSRFLGACVPVLLAALPFLSGCQGAPGDALSEAPGLAPEAVQVHSTSLPGGEAGAPGGSTAGAGGAPGSSGEAGDSTAGVAGGDGASPLPADIVVPVFTDDGVVSALSFERDGYQVSATAASPTPDWTLFGSDLHAVITDPSGVTSEAVLMAASDQQDVITFRLVTSEGAPPGHLGLAIDAFTTMSANLLQRMGAAPGDPTPTAEEIADNPTQELLFAAQQPPAPVPVAPAIPIPVPAPVPVPVAPPVVAPVILPVTPTGPGSVNPAKPVAPALPVQGGQAIPAEFLQDVIAAVRADIQDMKHFDKERNCWIGKATVELTIQEPTGGFRVVRFVKNMCITSRTLAVTGLIAGVIGCAIFATANNRNACIERVIGILNAAAGGGGGGNGGGNGAPGGGNGAPGVPSGSAQPKLPAPGNP